MIPQNSKIREEKPLWLTELSQSFKNPQELLSFLKLDCANFSQDITASKLFAFRVPLSFAQKMKKGDPNDPLFLQAITNQQEFANVAGFTTDPLDEQKKPAPNILHKYYNRVLFMVNSSCAINCRYCFRRHFPYDEVKSNKAQWQLSLDYIKSHSEIEEIIFSGGDPLMIKDEKLAWLINEIEQISQVKTLRIHTRLPVVIENRITDQLCNLFKNSPLNIVLVTHINHSQEIDELFKQKMQKLKSAGVLLLNQSVLLKNINDNPVILKELSDKLFSVGILPYYLHLLDKVAGAAHFLVEDDEALHIYKEFQAITSGYLVPKLTREIAGEKNKTIIS